MAASMDAMGVVIVSPSFVSTTIGVDFALHTTEIKGGSGDCPCALFTGGISRKRDGRGAF